MGLFVVEEKMAVNISHVIRMVLMDHRLP
jgi:hypothetical protein